MNHQAGLVALFVLGRLPHYYRDEVSGVNRCTAGSRTRLGSAWSSGSDLVRPRSCSSNRRSVKLPAPHKSGDDAHLFLLGKDPVGRPLIRERTFAGLKAARARGRQGRPRKLQPKEQKTIRALLKTTEVSV